MDLTLDEPTTVDFGRRFLVGLDFFGDPMRSAAGWSEENEIGRLWKRLMGWIAAHPDRLGEAACRDGRMYEVHVLHPETEETGEWEVFVGQQVDVVDDVPAALVAKVLPPGRYACFTLHGEQITGDWPLAISGWLEKHGYRPRLELSYQLYDERFRGLERIAESVIEVHVPLLPS